MHRKAKWLGSGFIAIMLLFQLLLLPFTVYAGAGPVPTVSTLAYSNVTGGEADLSGDITNDGGESLITRGFYYSVYPTSPLLGTPISEAAGGTGQFSGSLVDLLANTTYYYAAYATTVNGLGYGGFYQFTTGAAAYPTLDNVTHSNVTSTGATVASKVSKGGGALLTVRGFVYSSDSTATLNLSQPGVTGVVYLPESGKTGAFEYALAGLSPGTTYYVRSYATNSVGTAYSTTDQFTTPAVVATVTTSAYTNLTSTGITLNGSVDATGGATITEQGFVYSTTNNPPTTSDTKKVSTSTGLGVLTENVTGLAPGTTYYVRSYAINSEGTAYGTMITFTTPAVAATLTTSAETNLTSTSVTLNGSVDATGGAAITEQGFVYSTTNNPPTTGDTKKVSTSTGTGPLTESVTGLEPGTTYYVRAYAINSEGTAYGTMVQFTTSAVVATVTTSAYTNLTSNGVTLNGSVDKTGGAAITEQGFVYSTTSNPPTTADTKKISTTNGVGSLQETLLGLSPGTTYYVRAYAINSEGTAYGTMIQFTTPATGVTVQTGTFSNVTKTSATVDGSIVANGGTQITQQGFVYSKSNSLPAFETDTVKAYGTTGLGAFSADLTGLEPGTTYYVRAYATNSVGTTYGSAIQFTTIPLSGTGALQSAVFTGISFGTVTAETYNYSMSVPFGTRQTDFTPTLNQGAVSVTVTVYDPNGNIVAGSPFNLTDAQKSDMFALGVGLNKVQVEVKAENGSVVATYIFTIQRKQEESSAPVNTGGPVGTAPSEVPSNLKVTVIDPETGAKEANAKITQLVGPQLSMTGKLYSANGTALNVPEIAVNGNGAFNLPNIPAGEYKMVLNVVAPTGEKLAGRIAKLTVDSSGQATLEAELIDPYGTITDSVTGKPVDGVKVTLHWSDTELNKSKGRKPGDLVVLPILPDFAPNQNNDPQTSVNGGQYGWMVFPDGDYYILGEKEGYEPFDSRNDKRNEQQGDDSYIRNGIIHVGVSIVHYSFSIDAKVVDEGKHAPYMQGYEDQTFRPNGSMTRAELATILGRVLPIAATVNEPAVFTDVADSHWAAAAIRTAAEQGWLTGYPSGEFAPDQAVTRAELAQVLLNVKRWSTAGQTAFSDVAGHWGLPAIIAAEKQGLLSGYPDGTFLPDKAITRAESVKVFNKLLGRNPYNVTAATEWQDVPSTFWGYNDIIEASTDHAYEQLSNGYEVWKK